MIDLFICRPSQLWVMFQKRALLVLLFDVGNGAIVVLVASDGAVAVAEGARVVLERALVLELGAAEAVPEPAAVLLVRAPVALDGEGLAAAAAEERLEPVLALVVRLQRAEVLERLGARVVDVVPAPRRAAVARQPQHRRRLDAAQRFGALAVLRAVTPHVHLHPSPSRSIVNVISSH
jgi:hypothetical protein